MSSAARRFRYDSDADAVVEVGERVAGPAVDRGPMIGGAYSDSRPGKSISMSVHPSQCAMMNENLKAHGITGVHYDSTKRHNCVITNRRQRAKAFPIIGRILGMENLHDDDGGYSDG